MLRMVGAARVGGGGSGKGGQTVPGQITFSVLTSRYSDLLHVLVSIGADFP